MAISNKRMVFVSTGLGMCSALVAAVALVQDVSFEAARNYVVGEVPFSVAVADFNGDGVQDLVVAMWRPPGVMVLLGDGQGSFQEASRSPLSHSLRQRPGGEKATGRPTTSVAE